MTFVWLAPASHFPKSTTWQRGPTAPRPNPPITISGFPAGTEILLRLCLSGISHPWVLDGCTKWEVIVCWHWDPERPARLASCFLVVFRHKACESHSLHTSFRTLGISFANPAALSANSRLAGGGAGFLGCWRNEHARKYSQTNPWSHWRITQWPRFILRISLSPRKTCCRGCAPNYTLLLVFKVCPAAAMRTNNGAIMHV